jgi:hypothetical protein
MKMAKSKKVKGLCIPAPSKGVVGGEDGFTVVWSIDISAQSPKEAAEKAQLIMKDSSPDAFPPVFQVIDHKGHISTVDFEE